MKRFKDLTEELFTEGGEMYPADDMTMKELKIACYAAQNILDRLESGAMVQRWQISAIVKAKEELSSVYTSMSADEEGEEDYYDEWEDAYDEEPMYVGFEYPSMYEAVDKDHPIVKEYDALKKHDIDTLRGMAKKHGRVVDVSGLKTKDHAITHILRAKHGNKKVDQAFGLKEEADYKVTVDGLPDMYVKADSPSEVKNNLRKVVRNPDMIKGVERIAKASLQKMFRDKAAGKEVAEEVELDEAGSYRDRGALNMLKADQKAEREIAKMRAQAAKRAEKEAAKKKPVQEEADLEEGYNDSIHRKYISDTVHDYVAKDDPKHDKIVDHLHKAKSFGSKTVDSLSDHAGISLGAANAITKEVASNLKANFGTPQKTQTQAQRIGAYLKQKHIGPRSK